MIIWGDHPTGAEGTARESVVVFCLSTYPSIYLSVNVPLPNIACTDNDFCWGTFQALEEQRKVERLFSSRQGNLNNRCTKWILR